MTSLQIISLNGTVKLFDRENNHPVVNYLLISVSEMFHLLPWAPRAQAAQPSPLLMVGLQSSEYHRQFLQAPGVGQHWHRLQLHTAPSRHRGCSRRAVSLCRSRTWCIFLLGAHRTELQRVSSDWTPSLMSFRHSAGC